jgi:predicted CoA-binding protein/8-oxo-dGTP pyrophosphatase MutT (NUDIX family)
MQAGKILMLKRSEKVRTNPTSWSVVSGEVMAGESPIDTAYREMQEELSLRRSDLELILQGDVVNVHPKPDAITKVHTFLFTSGKTKFKLNYEHTQAIWVSVNGISALYTVPRFFEILKALGLLKYDMASDLPSDGLSDKQVKRIFSFKRIMVVGMSRDPAKPAHYAPAYLREHGYRIIPVNPVADHILGLKCYPSIQHVKEDVDIAYIFRPSDEVGPFGKDALRKKIKAIWMPEGVYNREVAEAAGRRKVTTVWNRCMKVEHQRLMT